MTDPRLVAAAEVPQPTAGADSHRRPPPARPRFDESELLQKLYWTVPEAAFMSRLSTRTVWRELSDPTSKFPRPRRVRGRTLLARDEVLRFLADRGVR